ncbi:MAG: single-stranded-DNA-specific exonuclease RecJ [Proteobacteria bacterium]|nr:single-stranded-DNA-specific exonuclease RecJ [Pseudomonadota bacterium]
MDGTWKVRTVDPSTVGRLAGALGVSPVTARCLAARGIDEADQARSYLTPRLGHLRRPSGLAGLPDAVARLADAIRAGQRIGVFGDYDVDGVTTAALMTTYLRQLGASVVPRVARRDAGYGFGCADADFFAGSGCKLVITGDCGTSDIDAIERAVEREMDVIVVDHHTVPSHDQHHPALALVNPFRPDSTFPFRDMASVGLSFYLMAALRTELRNSNFFATRPDPDLRELLDLVALGTVADLVPLRGENRILTAAGLGWLSRRLRPGVSALLQVAGVAPDRRVDERTIGWKLAPRLNAPGRMGDAEPALALLLAPDHSAAAQWAERLEHENEERRAAQITVLEQALEMLGESDPGPAVVVAGQGWPSGVTGIVAAKLVEMWQRPAFVIAIDPERGSGRGSGRSWGGINLYDVLHDCSELLERFGGHAGAGGLTVRSNQVDELRQAIQQAVASRADGIATVSGWLDAEVALADVDIRLCRELGSLAPFGRGNEEPLLICRGIRVRKSQRVGDGSHLKLEVEDQHGATRWGIAFGLGEKDPGSGAMIDAAFAPTLNVWRGQSRVELEIRHLDARRDQAAVYS